MTTRGRNSSADWDPMKDDYNNSSYDAQYQDNDNSSSRQLDHRKLYITNLPPGLNDNGLRAAFEKYGQIEHSFLSKDPTKKYAFVTFETAAEARNAMMKLNKTEPLNLNVNISHSKGSGSNNNNGQNYNGNRERDRGHRDYDRTPRDNDRAPKDSERPHRNSERVPRDKERNHRDSGSYVSNTSIERRTRNTEEPIVSEMESHSDMSIGINRDFHIQLEQIKLEKLRIQEEQLECKQKMMMLTLEKHPISNSNMVGSTRRMMPDGRIIVQSQVEKAPEADKSFTAGAGDSNETTCSCQKSWAKNEESDGGSSTPSTCVLCSNDRTPLTQSKRNSIEKSETSKVTDLKTSEYSSKVVPSRTTDATVSRTKFSKDVGSKQSHGTDKRCAARKCACKSRSEMTCDWKFREFDSDSDDETDETNRLIKLRNSDYMYIVDDNLKIVIVLAGYPKSKMGLRHVDIFQRCLTEVINMQLKANLLLKVPSFFDYYLNRGALVCICKDGPTRDWMVRVFPGLQERMSVNLVLLKTKVKRLGLSTLKIPRSSWPATAQSCFKLLQYFNPTLKTNVWKIYAQKIVDDVECTSFLIDRVSGEIIRGPNFKNVLDYDQMDFELTGYTEIYYECLLAGMEEDLSSVASRVKLLEEIKSAEATPRLASTVSVKSTDLIKPVDNQDSSEHIEPHISETKLEDVEQNIEKITDMKEEPDICVEVDMKNIKDVEHLEGDDVALVWSNQAAVNTKAETEFDKPVDYLRDDNTTTTSLVAMSEKSESAAESNDNLIIKTSTINIDSNRGIAYHRRTNYLHVENELKVAITLDGYPKNKLEGTHIRRLKHLFKEYLHKDMKSQRFTNLIIPKFQDIYLSNGAVIYICDSLETRDYLTEVLPKFINSTGLKLTFRDITNLVRYTRTVMRLPKEMANVESIEILSKLQEKYPGLKPDCWKYYSDVAGKQKRQFGVDPESLDIIKSADFDPIFEGEKLVFKIIDRQKRSFSCEESIKNETVETEHVKKQRHAVIKNMYVPIDEEIANAPLTRIRTNHYSDIVSDDLKLYVGPVNYPESRIDEPEFNSIKRTFENIVMDFLEKGDLSNDSIPKFHDIYLFDGVIFIICHSVESRLWIENNVNHINDILKINLKSTEFRGAVGIISMVVRTNKTTEEVIAILQEQNPRLRTKYWRQISTVKTSSQLDVVLQIDKLSAQVILEKDFNKFVGFETVEFKLGHLQSIIKPKSTLAAITQVRNATRAQKSEKKTKKSSKTSKKKSKKSNSVVSVVSNKHYYVEESVMSENEMDESPKLKKDQIQKEFKVQDLDPIIIQPESSEDNKDYVVPEENYQSKIILKIPLNILPDTEDDLSIIFDILEDKNPGLNTEIWQVFTESPYPSNGKFILYVDKQSLSVIQNKEFDSSVGGEKLMFYF